MVKDPMKDTTLISVVTPVYNGARFIAEAYACLCRQTYRNWEWVVVDDGSTDETRTMIRQLAETDRRISYTRQRNSGAAKLPRDRAVFQAKGELLMPLDIDDLLVDDYLQLMLQRMRETEADIVYPQMVFVNMATGETTMTLPDADFDTSRVYDGRSLVRETLPEWRIGCNGGLYRRQVWGNIYWLEEHEPIWVYSDEVDERHYQLQARRVAFAQARYYYQNHEDSITNKVSAKMFHILKTNNQLLDLIGQEFGYDSEEYRLANLKTFYGWRSMTAYYLKHYPQLPDADGQIQHDLKQTFARIDASLLPKGDRMKFLNLCNEHLLQTLMALKYSPRWLVEKLMQRTMPTKYRWNVIRRRTEEQTTREIKKSYEHTTEKPGIKPVAISMFCGNVASGGLVDRLRGAVSLYSACKQAERPFRLYFTHPFPLTDYLVPNEYDWTITPEEVSFAPSQTHTVVIDTQTDTDWESQWQQQQFATELGSHTDRQLHFYSNAFFGYNQDFAKLFSELFKPSPRLQASIDKNRKLIGGSYITVSARFCNLLDDFNEETYSEPLTLAEQKDLLDACVAEVKRLHSRHPEQFVVVCSDSETFTQRAQSLDYVRVLPGIVSHIGNDSPHNYEYYEKTFLDFFTIAGAERVYLLRAPLMHNSGFPYAAARVGRRHYEVVEIED